MSATAFIAVDVGNARIKLGLFAGGIAAELPEPLRTLSLPDRELKLGDIAPWLAGILPSPFGRGAGGEGTRGGTELSDISLPTGPHPDPLPKGEGTDVLNSSPVDFPTAWWIASVNRPAATRLIDWLRENRPDDRAVLLACGDLPLVVRLERADMVGIDRLVDAVAVNRLRDPKRPAVIVDVGTAITVDLVSADGAFLGGAILPGIQMAARAMHHFTDLLPMVNVSNLTAPPPALGTSTESAMRAGLFWGAVGAIRQLAEQLSSASDAANPMVLLTGGAGAAVAELLGPETRFVPNLTLSGIAEVAKRCEASG